MKISVCMAVYNGEKYLAMQIASILAQLRPLDELIIVNDASQDDSLKIIKNICDDRVRIYSNDLNRGVIASFEKVLTLAQGDIIFLSDQDDIWLVGKVEKTLHIFSQHKNITLVTSDAQIIDAFGNLIEKSYFSQRGKFMRGILHNIIKNKYIGCTIAFRRSMLAHFIPIPNDVPMHDMWFGILNELHGETYYIKESLIAYRRHDKNTSSMKKSFFLRQLIWRWCLIKNLLLHFFRFLFIKL